jgi:hypothetical protein
MDTKDKITFLIINTTEKPVIQTNTPFAINQAIKWRNASSNSLHHKINAIQNLVTLNKKQNSGQIKYCKFCKKKDGHTGEKYFALEKAEKKIKISRIKDQLNNQNQ